uniref:Uncharacterized protein n=1 Tax=Leersia perrieri TaxID=77586 RepID=A0A0D9WAM7_9ORYZ
MAPSTRVWLLAVVLVACVVAVAGAGEEEAAAAPAPAVRFGGIFGCNPLTDKTCRPGGDHRGPENQEEEGGFGVRVPSVPGDIDGDGDDDELPSFDTHMNILGH